MNYQDLSYMIKEMNKIQYPELVDVKENYRFGRMVYDSYAGGKSELTTILTYVYQFLTNDENNELAMALKMISMQEMKHLELLGEILVGVGCKPYYMNTYGNKWCSDNVRSSFENLEDMLKYNIEGEKDAINEYNHLINVCDNDSIKAVLSRIIMDEECHIQIFMMFMEKYCGKID